MTMFAKSLAGVFTSRADVVAATDPWGLDVTCGVLRSGHEDWQRWRKENLGGDPFIETMRRATTKATLKSSLREQIKAAAEQETRAGFRRRKRPTRAQLRRQAEKVSQLDEGQIEGLVEDIVAEMGNGAVDAIGRSLNTVKPGVALILLQWWKGRGVMDSGQVNECSLPNKLEFLGWEGVLVTAKGAPHFFDRSEFAELPADSELAGLIKAGEAEVREFEGNPRDDDGRVIWVPEFYPGPHGQPLPDEEGKPRQMPYGGQPAGDAITEWLLDASEDAEEGFASDLAETARDLDGTPATESGHSEG